MATRLLVIGSSNIDYSPAESVQTVLSGRHVNLQFGNRQEFGFELLRSANPGDKVEIKSTTADELLGCGLDLHPETGGCGFNTAVFMQHLSSQFDLPLEVTFVDSAAPSQEVGRHCAQIGIRYVALDLHRTQRNFNFELLSSGDKLTLREEVRFSSGVCVQDTLTFSVGQTDILAMIAPKCSALCEFDRCIDMLMITPSTPLKALQRFHRSRLVIGNLSELTTTLRPLGIKVQSYDENGSEAPRAAKRVLGKLRRMRYSGSLICTLGRNGAVVSPSANHFYWLRPIVPVPTTRSRVGDFTAASILLHKLRDPGAPPVIWAVLASMDAAEWLGAQAPEVQVLSMSNRKPNHWPKLWY